MLNIGAARYYDPSEGRFLSEDPIGFDAGDSNLFRYVFNNPLNGRDPNGTYCTTLSGAVVCGVILGTLLVVRQCNQKKKNSAAEEALRQKEILRKKCENDNAALEKYCSSSENQNSGICNQTRKSCDN